MKIRKYHHYHFTGQDPIVAKIRHLVGNDRNTDISKDSGVASSTLSNWWSGRTKRPKFSTCAAIIRSYGADLVIVEKKKRKP